MPTLYLLRDPQTGLVGQIVLVTNNNEPLPPWFDAAKEAILGAPAACVQLAVLDDYAVVVL